MSNIVKNSQTGLYFVQDKGFSGTGVTATRFGDHDGAQDVVDCAKSMGIVAAIEEVKAEANPHIVQNANGISYAPNYIRKGDVKADGSVAANRNNPSPRRFRTESEASHHAARFKRIEKHSGFFVTESTDPVNAWVNQVSGKTNPVIGRARTNRD